MKFEELIIEGEKEKTNNLMTDNRNNINKNRNWLNIKDYSNENYTEKIINDIEGLEKSNNKQKFFTKFNLFKGSITKSYKRRRKLSCRKKIKDLLCCRFKQIIYLDKEYKRDETEFHEYTDLIKYIKKMQEIDI